jgi:hypothetical protein
MPTTRRIVVLTRLRDPNGRTALFTLPGGRGRGRSVVDFIAKERVPEFEGDSATFEIEKVREPGCPWLRWRVVRRVD